MQEVNTIKVFTLENISTKKNFKQEEYRLGPPSKHYFQSQQYQWHSIPIRKLNIYVHHL
jgi:hypothetical protein